MLTNIVWKYVSKSTMKTLYSYFFVFVFALHVSSRSGYRRKENPCRKRMRMMIENKTLRLSYGRRNITRLTVPRHSKIEASFPNSLLLNKQNYYDYLGMTHKSIAQFYRRCEAFSVCLWINDYKNLINERWSYVFRRYRRGCVQRAN